MHVQHIVQFAHLFHYLLHAAVILDHQPHAAGGPVVLWRHKDPFKILGASGIQGVDLRHDDEMEVYSQTK